MLWQPMVLSALGVSAVLLFFWQWRHKFGGPNANVPEFVRFGVDFFMAGAGAVALMLLTKFLGIQALSGSYVVTIILGLLLLVVIFGVVFTKLYASRNWRRKLGAYACVCMLVIACFFRPTD